MNYVQGLATLGEPLVIERVFGAPRTLVWKAWTEPELVKRWWGPKDFTAPVVKIDFREGGINLMCMRSPEGKDFWSTGTYLEIVAPKRIVVTDSFADDKGNKVPATYYGMSPDIPLDMLQTVTFEGPDGMTKVTIEHFGLPAGPDRDDARAGWNQSLDKLEMALADPSYGRR